MPQNKRKKTFLINDLVDMINEMNNGEMPPMIKTGVHATKGEDGNPKPVTLEEAYRAALCNVVENILHETNRYQGFSYTTNDITQPSPLKRTYSKFQD
jgi:hypothetical protein